MLVSYVVYLRDQLRTFTVLKRGTWQRAKTEIIISEQSASLSHLGKLWEMQLPSVIYLSEFQLVLSFRPEAEKEAAEAAHLVLLPDSPKYIEDRRLRRYLRFNLPASF